VTLKEFSNGEEGVSSLIYVYTFISYLFLISLSKDCKLSEGNYLRLFIVVSRRAAINP